MTGRVFAAPVGGGEWTELGYTTDGTFPFKLAVRERIMVTVPLDTVGLTFGEDVHQLVGQHARASMAVGDEYVDLGGAGGSYTIVAAEAVGFAVRVVAER